MNVLKVKVYFECKTICLTLYALGHVASGILCDQACLMIFT